MCSHQAIFFLCGLGEILGEGEEGQHRVGGGLDCLFGLFGCFLLLGLGGGCLLVWRGLWGCFCLLCWMLHGFDWENKVKLACIRTCHGLRTSLIIKLICILKCLLNVDIFKLM